MQKLTVKLRIHERSSLEYEQDLETIKINER